MYDLATAYSEVMLEQGVIFSCLCWEDRLGCQ